MTEPQFTHQNNLFRNIAAVRHGCTIMWCGCFSVGFLISIGKILTNPKSNLRTLLSKVPSVSQAPAHLSLEPHEVRTLNRSQKIRKPRIKWLQFSAGYQESTDYCRTYTGVT